MEIRELQKGDIPSLLELYIQLDTVNNDIQQKRSDMIWNEIEKNPAIKYFGAVENNIVISTCYAVIIPNLTNHGQPLCFIENVVTDAAYRSRGIGKQVMEKAIEFAKEKNCYKVILQSGNKRIRAHQFYKRLGFNPDTKQAFDMRL